MAQQTQASCLTQCRRVCMAMPGSWAADRGGAPACERPRPRAAMPAFDHQVTVIHHHVLTEDS